jgi:nucleoside-diphosphate-sugar epimerase
MTASAPCTTVFGGVGREVVTQALDAGPHVTAYVRKLTVTHPDLSVATGELTDRDAVQRALSRLPSALS